AINSVYQKLKKRLVNIILIGMPYAGKTTLGCRLSGILRRPLIDIDLELSKKKISLFTVDESEFRKREAALTVNYAHKTGLIIATGGGIILNPEAMAHLKENGVVVFLDTPLEVLATRLDDTRPLIRSNQDLEQLYEQRINLYRQYADIVVAADEIDKIGAMLDEYFSD
ncbi:MAG: shikimate kinase, partial [Bacilli bacterium]|nr:shikimate kinase [Bacilli bacterium]